MDTLHYVEGWAEANGLDEQLPVEFWLHVASAADGMEFPESSRTAWERRTACPARTRATS